MTRILLASIAALALVIGAGWGSQRAGDTRREHHASAELVARAASIDTEQRRWQTTPDGFAATATRDEALRTLGMLRELYAQEERLWTYYQALGQSHQTRSQLTDERAELERRVARHEAHLRELDASLQRLRPPEVPTGITFTDH
ncbi:MAG: hypothetical protein PF961_00020 [Planctomycetota bacterium]|jgi:hypothetical protein|nr:hypothetical protein [Planctomycetota bacterium]